MENELQEAEDRTMTPNIIPEELARAKDALSEVGISGLPLFKTENGERIAINCTIDTRGLSTQIEVYTLITTAKRAIHTGTNLPVNVQATGHTLPKVPATLDETIKCLQDKYDH